MEKETYGWVLIGSVLLLLASGMIMGTGHMGMVFGIGSVLMLLFWIVVIWLIFSLLEKDIKQDPIQILRKRYANGEISKKQFDNMKREL